TPGGMLGRALSNPTVLFHAEPILEQDSIAHADRSRRPVVIVVAGVLAVDPADEPDVQVRVAVELLVEARSRVVAGVGAPDVLRCGQLSREARHRRTIEVRVWRNTLTDPGREIAHARRREGVSDWRTWTTASPKPRTASSVGRESTTGVSLPYAS